MSNITKTNLTQEQAEQFKEMMDTAALASDLTKDKAVHLFGAENVHDGYYTCPLCKKHVPISDIARDEYSEIVKDKIVDTTCKECRDLMVKEKACRIVCVKCKEVFCYMPPSKNKVTGFEMKPGHTYHIMECPKCNPEIKQTNIIESEIYKQKYGKGVKI